MPIWQTARFAIDLSQPRVMGIVNVTPDSFSADGLAGNAAAAMAQCERMAAEGAAILDIGGESTRPGAVSPSPEDELARVLPVVRHAVRLGVAVSVDTSQPLVMRAVLDAGADIINDVRALAQPAALDECASHPKAGVCLMHMRGEPGSMQDAPAYTDVLLEVSRFLAQRRDAAVAAGIARERIALDPGVGFGKTVQHNLQLLARQQRLLELGQPLLVGWSRKSTLGRITGREVHERLAASLAAAVLAVERGARVVRVHDVAATVDALKIWQSQHDQQHEETGP
jgi:dihydropteroate synthase